MREGGRETQEEKLSGKETEKREGKERKQYEGKF